MYFNDFFDLLPDTLSWNRPFREVDGYSIINQKDGKGIIIVFNTLGVSKEDLKVSNNIKEKSVDISVQGKTHLDEINKDYEVKYSLRVTTKYNEKVEDVKYNVKDGLTFVYIKTKKDSLELGKKEETKYIDQMVW